MLVQHFLSKKFLVKFSPMKAREKPCACRVAGHIDRGGVDNRGAKIAKISTNGVYILATFDTKVSILAFLSVADSVKDSILATVLDS